MQLSWLRDHSQNVWQNGGLMCPVDQNLDCKEDWKEAWDMQSNKMQPDMKVPVKSDKWVDTFAGLHRLPA